MFKNIKCNDTYIDIIFCGMKIFAFNFYFYLLNRQTTKNLKSDFLFDRPKTHTHTR